MILRSERRESVESVASWFLEKYLGAHWFMPGPLGEFVPHATQLVLAEGEETVRPGFISRDLGRSAGPEGRDWYGRNRLEARFDHGHNLATIFRPEDLARVPEMAPMRNGARLIPVAGDQGWQPNMLSAAAVQHAADVANRAFDRDPARLTFSLSINDAVRFDDSAETMAAISPVRYFRYRPDYSNLVFRFTNAVAEKVAQRHPDRWLPAYAYYWCENTPDFPVARNVVPFLTADRSQWSHPEFAAEDRALIERWCRSGAAIVGIYDYFEGGPYLSPRPMLYAVKASIPFEHQAGARAFFGEGDPNWALDGPKPWLAAQLLWNPQQDPDALLEVYFREFWAEAAAPMRRYFAICEDVWLKQPGPALWLRYYQDDDQAWIYPPVRRAELRAQLSEAARAASSALVRARVDFVSAGLSVSEAFWDFAAARDAFGKLAHGRAKPPTLLAAWERYRAGREAFVRTYADVRRAMPLAVSPQSLDIYLRNQPDSRGARDLVRSEEGRALLQSASRLTSTYINATPREIDLVTTAGTECLLDPGWKNIVAQSVRSPGTIEWTQVGAIWRGSGEPWEGRTVEFKSNAAVRRVLRMAGCRTEAIGQWGPATPGTLYAAQAKVRAKTSPGTATFLIMSFLDEKGRHIGIGQIDRLSADPAVQETELCVITRAPANARSVGVAVRVLNQINDDFAEFSDVSLRSLAR